MGKDKQKTLPAGKANCNKKVTSLSKSTNHLCPVLRFNKLDRNGPFAFDMRRNDFNHKEVLEKLIEYSNLSWNDIMHQTHDKGNKTKHHFLSTEALSREAVARIEAMHLQEESDNIFSFAFQNLLRIIGIRDGETFYVIWYDPNHKFCPSTKK